MSSAGARVAMVPHVSGAPSSERSDPYMEWALRFDQDLMRAGERIRTWYRSSAQLADEDLEAPSRVAFSRAIEAISQLKTMVMDRVAPTTAKLLDLKGVSLGSGGEISFELASGPFAVTCRVESDGGITQMYFKNNQLFRREHIPR